MTSDLLVADPGERAVETLGERPVRSHDERAELIAFAALAEDLEANPARVPTRVVDLMVSLGRAGSAGLSLIAEDGARGRFSWHAVAGAWAGHAGRQVLFDASPCSVAVSTSTPQLIARPQVRFPGWDVDPQVDESLILPLAVRGRIFGALWMVAHDTRQRFDASDLELLSRLGSFVRTAHCLQVTPGKALKRSHAARGRVSPRVGIGSSEPVEFRDLRDAIGEAYCAIELASDGDADAHVIRDVNPVFARVTCLPDAVGRSLGELGFHGGDHVSATLRRIARTGQPRQIDLYLEPGRVFSCRAFRIGDPTDPRVAMVLRDASDSTQRERCLFRREAHQAFLLRLGDTLRPLADPVEVQVEAVRALGDYLAADRTFYSELNPLTGAVIARRDHFGFEAGFFKTAFPAGTWSKICEQLGQGKQVLEENIEASEQIPSDERAALAAIDIRSFVAIPLIKQNRLVGAVTVCHAEPRSWRPGETWLVRQAAECAWAAIERTRGAAALRESEERFRKLTNSVPALVWLATPDGANTFISDRGRKFYGLSPDEARGDGWKDALHPDDVERISIAWAESCERGTNFEADLRYRRKQDGVYRWQLTQAEPMRNEAGAITSWIGSAIDIHDLRRLQEHQKLLLAELQHRVRNTLAVVRSVARRTATTSDSIDGFAANFEGRLDAFARTQAVVTRDPSKGVSLDYMVAEELLAFAAHERAGGREGGQLQIEGPEVRFQPKAAETFALAIHELATNAIKHGALAACGTSRGRLVVKWHVEANDGEESVRRLVFSWVETRFGSAITGPRRRGFGMELLERTLQYELKARTTLVFETTGLHCTIVMPLTSRVSWQGLG